MLNKELTLKQIFDSFISANRILVLSYKQYDELTKKDILFDFKYEFLKELEYHVKNDDWLDLVSDFDLYCDNKENQKPKLKEDK